MALIDTIVQAGYVGEGYGHQPAAALAEGALFIVDMNGDLDPGRVMIDVAVHNTGAVDLWFAENVTDAVTAASTRRRIPAGKSRFFAGAFASFVIYNPQGSGASCVWGFDALRTAQHLPDVRGGHPGHGQHPFRVVVVQDDIVELELVVQRRCTLAGAKAFSNSENTSAAGGVTFLLQKGEGDDAVDLLGTVPYDLEAGITNDVLDDIALTAETEDLDLEVGDVLHLIFESDNVDLVEGDLAIVLIYTLR